MKKEKKRRSEEKKKAFGMLMAFITVFSVLAVVIPAVANAPGGDGMQIPSAMNLTADPEWIYINGDQSLITATVYDNENYTDPIPYAIVNFTTSRGIITNVGEGGSISERNCWAMTNESGVAIVALAPVIGSESGIATVKAVTGKGDVWKEVTVEFVKAEWRVVLFPDNESKETEVNENATYYIKVRNAGTADDTYDLSITSNDADYAGLNKTSVSLVANTSEIVELNVKDSTIGSYNTTVRAASAHASWEITVTTIVRAYGVELKVEGGDYAEKTVAPGATAIYSLTVKNTGNGIDSYDLSVDNISNADVAVLDQDIVTNLAAGASADVLLTVSDATVGEYIVNVTAISQGNPSVSDTITTVTNVSEVAEPDLIVTEITLSAGDLFANQSNEICATVKNNGTGAAGAFNVSFNVDGFSEEVRVDGLTVGENTTVCVNDTTLRIAGESVTILVTADCDAEVNESDETNNDKSIVETVVAGPQPDLLVTEITPNQLLANESNEICAAVKNNGTADTDAFNVSFNVDGFSEEVRVDGGLAVGAETTVCVTDPTWRTEGESVTITVTADCNAEIDESDEMNNAKSIVATVVEKVTGEFVIQLYSGMNLVSIPLIPETLNNLPVWNHTTFSVDTVANPIINCSPMDYNITTIWRYNATAGSFGASLDYQGVFGDFDYWYSADPTFKGIEPDRGYFFVVKQGGAFEWTVVGSVPVEDRAVDLVEDMNLVGMTSTNETRGLLPVWNHTTFSVDTVENPIINCSPANYNITTIWRYNATAGSFGASLDYQGVFGDFDYWYSADPTFKGIEPGRGYFFVVKPGGAFTWRYEP